MEKDASYFAVGLFVSVTLVALIGFCIWLLGSHERGTYDNYTVYFTDAVSGLNEGASVQYKGVEVGRVTDIRLAPERADLIKVDIQVDETTPVRANTKATLNMLGVTGLVYIELRTDPGDNKPVAQVAGERYPVLNGSGTQLAKLFQEIPEITKQVRDIAERLGGVVTEENTKALSQTLQNVQTASAHLNEILSARNADNLDKTLSNIAASSQDFRTMVKKWESTASEAQKAAASLSKVVTRNQANIDKFSQDGLEQITAMARETRRMTESIRKITDKLNEDPSQLLYKPNYYGVEIEK